MSKFIFPLSKTIVQTMWLGKGKFSAYVIHLLDTAFHYFGRHFSTRTGRPAEKPNGYLDVFPMFIGPVKTFGVELLGVSPTCGLNTYHDGLLQEDNPYRITPS